jgi:tetratricopeptide (TPR) repeat protein
MGMRALLVLLLAAAPLGAAADPFREANDLARAGDYPKAIEAYHRLAAAGTESASLYWNWAQAAAARGETGEALWALLRGREVEPSDRATAREIERLREAANLDPSEIAPSPLAAAARLGRRLHLHLVALLLLAASIALHALARTRRSARPLSLAAAGCLVAGLLAAAAPVAGHLASPTAVVVRRGAPLLDAASPTASTIGSLRHAEVVLILDRSEGYLRVEDSSGARGWASQGEVWPLDRPPSAR